MRNKIKRIQRTVFSFLPILVIVVPMAFSVSAYAVNLNEQVCSGSKNLNLNSGPADCSTTSVNSSSVSSDIQTVVEWFSIIVGIIAVVMIIVGGLKYITSGGESSKVSSAKTTIIYAIVGLIIVALAQIIVHFVLAKSTSTLTGSSGT